MAHLDTPALTLEEQIFAALPGPHSKDGEYPGHRYFLEISVYSTGEERNVLASIKDRWPFTVGERHPIFGSDSTFLSGKMHESVEEALTYLLEELTS